MDLDRIRIGQEWSWTGAELDKCAVGQGQSWTNVQ